jgi:hypothetical protein
LWRKTRLCGPKSEKENASRHYHGIAKPSPIRPTAFSRPDLLGGNLGDWPIAAFGPPIPNQIHEIGPQDFRKTLRLTVEHARTHARTDQPFDFSDFSGLSDLSALSDSLCFFLAFPLLFLCLPSPPLLLFLCFSPGLFPASLCFSFAFPLLFLCFLSAFRFAFPLPSSPLPLLEYLEFSIRIPIRQSKPAYACPMPCILCLGVCVYVCVYRCVCVCVCVCAHARVVTSSKTFNLPHKICKSSFEY